MIKHILIITPALIVMSMPIFANKKGRNPSIALIEVAVMDTKHEFIRAGEITTDSKNNIFVADDYGYVIKKFSSKGHFLGEYGGRGKKEREFSAFLFRLISLHDTLAVSELGSSRIRFYSPEFKFIKAISVGGTIVDIALDRKSRIYASVLPLFRMERDYVQVYDKDGNFLNRVPLEGISSDNGLNMAQLAIDRNNNLIVGFHFINRIEIFDERQRRIAGFRVQGLPDSSATIKSNNEEIGSVPKGELIKDIAADMKGNIFVLLGDYAKHPDQEVLVYDMNGVQRSAMVLPAKTGFMYIDDEGFMYTRERERTIVKKYKLMYHGF